MVKRSFITKSKLILAGSVLAFAFALAGTVTVLNAHAAQAQAAQGQCDDVNIIRCGLVGGTIGDYVSSFKGFYTSGTDGVNHDLKAVFQWAGATDGSVAAMNTSNTKLGTLYRNGDIKVDGKVVGTDSWVSARFTEGEGFVHIEGNVYARKTTTSFAQDSAPVIVHFGANGAADFAVMTGCGNAIKFTPVAPPVIVVTCDLLTASKLTTPVRTYSYKVQATAKNTTIVSYDFHYGDGKVVNVKTSDTTATNVHTFPEDGKSYVTWVAVNTTDRQGVTSDKCRATITTPSLTCNVLTAQQVTNKPLEYTFAATATAKGTKIVSYVFHFGDGKTMTVKTSAATATAAHTYAETNHTYVAFVEVNSTDESNVTSKGCKVTFTTPKPDECKPGVPVGSTECNTTPPVITPPTTPTPPTELVNTGAGSVIGLFGAASVLGVFLHRFILRRRFQS